MTPLEVALNGALAGALGALALTLMILVVRRLTLPRREPGHERGHAAMTLADILAEGPDSPPDFIGATATFVQKLATGLFGVSLTRQQQLWAGMGWHLLYGAFWAVPYALLQASVTVPNLLLGPAYGVLVWLVGPVWLVPKMRLMLPVRSQRAWVALMVFAGHLSYGALVALTFAVLQALTSR